MTDMDLIRRLLMVPYKLGGSTFSGADCWGMVMLWHRCAHSRALPGHRAFYTVSKSQDSIGPNVEVAKTFGMIYKEIPDGGLQEIPDDSIVLMKSEGEGIRHCGVMIGGSVLHTEKKTGPLFQPITMLALRHRIMAYGHVC